MFRRVTVAHLSVSFFRQPVFIYLALRMHAAHTTIIKSLQPFTCPILSFATQVQSFSNQSPAYYHIAALQSSHFIDAVVSSPRISDDLRMTRRAPASLPLLVLRRINTCRPDRFPQSRNSMGLTMGHDLVVNEVC